MTKSCFKYTFLFLFIAQIGFGQTLKSSLEKMMAHDFSTDVYKQYLSPLSVSLGMNMASGFSQTAMIKQFPQFGIMLNIISTGIPKDEKSFQDPSGVIRPTLFGDVSEGEIEGLGLDNLMFPVLQFHLGFFSNLEMIVRYTKWDLNHLGLTELRGFGIKYGLIEVPISSGEPLYVSLLANYQNLEMENIIESAAFGMTFNISKSFNTLPFILIGGVQYTKNILKFESNNINANSTMGTINIDGIDGLVYQAGLGYQLFFLRMHIDYNIGIYNTVTGGISLEF